jgi:hypothetical protein
VLGRITNRVGLIAPSSGQVIYTNAFDGLVRADLIYHYSTHSLEQDIRLAQNFELPKAFKAENTRIQIWTEWFGTEPISTERQTITLRADLGAGEVTASDETINLGAMKIVAGAAFRAGSENERVPVSKAWIKSKEDGRTWLVETLDYLAIKPALDTLPKTAMFFPSSESLLRESELLRSLEPRIKETSPSTPMLIADSGIVPDSGVILDFVIVNSVPVPPGAVSWWPAGGNANDAIGNNDGSLRGEITFAPGKVGQGFSQDGYVDCANVGNPANLQLQDFTIEAWIKRASTTSASLNYGGGIFFSHGWGGYGFGVVDDGSLFLTRVGIDNVTLGQAITDTAWHHVAVTKSGTEAIIYVDGIGYLMPEYETWYDFYYAFAVGARGDYDLNSFLGSIDELAVYNRALSPSEIEAIFNAGGAGKFNPNCSSVEIVPGGWWPGDNNAYDYTSVNADAVLQNGATYEEAVVAQGFSFDGVNDGVTVTDNDALDVGAGENFTVECWIKALPNNTTWGITTIADKRETPNPYQCLGWVFCLVNGQVACRISDNISGAGIGWGPVGPNLVSLGGFHHVAMTLNRGLTTGGHMYVDGVSVLEFNPTGVSGSLANTHALNIGVHAQSGFNGYHKGIIDELTVYKRELSATEISAIYSAGCAGKCKEDGDGLPDIWEWQHFGNLDQVGTAGQGTNWDYDSDGISNLDEYANGTDPNTISFSISSTNDYVSNTTTTLQLGVTGGVPSSEAVLLDSTNFSNATWTSYDSSSVTVALGTTEGWHDVWIGLRGRTTSSEQTWQWKRMKLDHTPPAITVTNPADAAVSQPMIQLQGYSPEAFSTISCDVSNAAGVFAEETILVLDQFYDTNTFEFTTNTFQGFDLVLTEGVNTVTIRATDLAGNQTTTNFDFTLVSDTIAPVFQLWWPQDGAELCGDAFTWRGLVDDFTATLTVEVVDASGNTNTSSAIVERDGKFWFENLPLANGLSTLTLTALDFWGNVTTTNINVSKSAVQLAIDPLAEDSLNDATITVTGTLNVSDHTVWVNGVKATLNGDGTWTAEGVPLNPGGTAVIQARAVPNSDNGGNGTGGSGGSGATMQNPGNPTSPQQKDTGAESDKKAQLYIYKDDVSVQKSDDTVRFDEYDLDFQPTGVWSTGQYWDYYEQPWKYDPETRNSGAGNGTIDSKFHGEYSDYPPVTYGPCASTFVWPIAGWPGQAYVTSCNGGHSWMNAPPIASEHCGVKNPPPQDTEDWVLTAYGVTRIKWHYQYTRTAQTQWKLFTGGKARPARNALWRIRGPAWEILDKKAKRPFTGANKRQIPNGQIKIFGKTLHTDGTIFKTLANGQTLDVPFEVSGTGSDFYTFGPGATPYYLISRCVCPRPDLDRTTLGVAEEVNLYWSSNPKGTDNTYPSDEPIVWTASAGTVAPVNAWPTKFTAPATKNNATVTATVRAEKVRIGFGVSEPSGIQATIRSKDCFSPPTIAVGMEINVILQPSSVSFKNVEVQEPAEATTTAPGYFADCNCAPSHADYGAGPWNSVTCENLVVSSLGHFDHAWFQRDSWMGHSGSFTWPIHARWRVSRSLYPDSPDHPLNGWTGQTFTLESDGTLRVSKFGLSVTRGRSEDCSH